MTTQLTISNPETLAMVLGGKLTQRVVINPGVGTMVNMNIVEGDKVSLVGVCMPSTDLTGGKPKSGVQYDIDTTGAMVLVKSAKMVEAPAETMGCSMTRMQRQCQGQCRKS